MREILFRGQCLTSKKWVEGHLIYFKSFPCIRYLDSAGFYHEEYVIPETVGQYTGLNDKNKAKIFEGDIVRCHDSYDEFIAVVEFGNPNSAYNWGFQLKPITKTDFDTDILLWVEMEEAGAFIEVIGNVHDNPKLIGGEPR